MFDKFKKLTPGGEPPSAQIIKQFKLLVLRGLIKDGDEIPARRKLAVHLGVNPLTVQKAFFELEEAGLVRSSPSVKSVVRVDDEMLIILRGELLDRQVTELVVTAVSAGVGCDEMIEMVKSVYDWAGNFGKNRSG